MNLYDETKVGKKYFPLQFDYHAPSEHTIDGYHYDLELHIVHRDENSTELSVLGILFHMKKGGNSSNSFLDQWLDSQLTYEGESGWISPKIDVKQLVDGLNNRRIYDYEGQLTTPPCSEIVEWIVIDDPQTISKE